MPVPENRTGQTPYALSLKQPWAALVVHGLKVIDVRTWPTVRRGRVLIHAARIPDDRPDAWNWVPKELASSAQHRGGIVGAAEVTGCVTYQSRDAFAADRAKHLNNPHWFDGRTLYGFSLAKPEVLPFRPYPGWVRFFLVNPETKV